MPRLGLTGLEIYDPIEQIELLREEIDKLKKDINELKLNVINNDIVAYHKISEMNKIPKYIAIHKSNI